MSLTLGLNTALSGLLTSQRGLDVIAQNVVNVNTEGYTRKVMNPESRVLAGFGAGVQEGGLTRVVDEGLLKDIRRQNSNLGTLTVEKNYYPRIEDLFGEVGDDSSIAHKMQAMFEGFEVLATEVNKPAMHWATVQAGQDVTDLMGRMSDQLQSLRLEADRDIQDTVALVNEQISNIHDLNQKIVRNKAINAAADDLEDKRDTALSKLSEYMDIQYFTRNDGSVTVYAGSGAALLDNSPHTVAHAATTSVDSRMTLAGGNFDKITIDGGEDDLGPSIKSGQLRALLDMRDTNIPNLQAQMDELAIRVKEEMNLAHNRGTTLPAMAHTFTGTRTFALQADITAGVENASEIISGTGAAITSADYTNLTWSASATNPGQISILPGASTAFAAFSTGDTFSITGSANAGTYRLMSNPDGVTGEVIVEKMNPRQTFSLTGAEDVSIGIFDNKGIQESRTTLKTVMGGNGPWTIDQVADSLQTWLRNHTSEPDLSSAEVALNADGKFAINLRNTSYSLAFRDQVSGTAGAEAADVTVKFDADGDGTADESVKGFSNFFGLNDFFVSDQERSAFDSKILDSSFATNTSRTFRILDATGHIGNEITVAQGSSLDDIAEAINTATKANESAQLTTTSWTLSSNLTISVTDNNGTPATFSWASGDTVDLNEIAGRLTQNSVTAAVVQDGSYYRLRITDSRGEDLAVTVTGGTVTGGRDLGEQLSMTRTSKAVATVVPEGSGFRLRIEHGENHELFVAADEDALGKSILTDLGLQRAANRMSSQLDVRADIKTAPEKISRGIVQWNADIGQYYMSEGDNTTALELARVANAKVTMDSAGGIHSGSYSFSEYASASISIVARDANHSKEQFDYQSTLNQSLNFQYTSYSGVNLDEEVTKMIDFQQAYSAAAKVISTLQQMLEELVNIVH